MRRPIGRLLAFAGLLFIVAITLVPLPQQSVASQITPLWCLVCGDYGGVDVINNLLLFIPFGFGLRLLGVQTRAVVAIGAGLSLGIELLQWGVIPGRDASLSDVLTNTLGSWVGAVVATYLTPLVKPNPSQALRLSVWAGAIWLGVQIATALLLQPWAPSGELRGAWARSVYGRAPYKGQVISAYLSGWPLQADPQPMRSEVATQIRAGHIHLEVQLLSGRRGSLWSPIVELLGPRGAVLAIYALRKDLAFQPPMRSSSVRLGRPALRLPGALPRPPGIKVEIAAGERRSTVWAEWTIAGVKHTRVQALSPSFGWSLLTPFRYAYGREVRFITAIWIAGLLAPIGYWSGHAPGRHRTRLSALLLLVSAGLALVPLVAGYPPVHWTEWAAALLGLAAGWAGHRSGAYFERDATLLPP
jgi:hypothetical protein